MCVCGRVSETEQKPQLWTPPVAVGHPHCKKKVHVTPLLPPSSTFASILLAFLSVWPGRIHLNLHTRTGPHTREKKTRSHRESLGSQLTCAATLKANFLSRLYRKRRLEEEEEGRLRERKREGGSELPEHGNGPEEKHSSDSRCGNTLFTFTHTHTQQSTQRRRARGNEDQKAPLCWRTVIGRFRSPELNQNTGSGQNKATRWRNKKPCDEATREERRRT